MQYLETTTLNLATWKIIRIKRNNGPEKSAADLASAEDPPAETA